MNILITGGAGYLGSILIEELYKQQHFYNITVIDNLMYRQTSLLPFCHRQDFTFEYADVRQENKLRPLIGKADVIIPLAAIVGAPACNKDPQLAEDVNTKHIQSIMDWKRKDQLVVMPNTNSGYGVGTGDTFCTEETPLNPISHYGRTKCKAEEAVMSGGGVSLRLATVFGMSYRQRLDLLVNDFTYRALTDGFLALFEQHFKRNYIHVRDVAKAFIFMIEQWYTSPKVLGNAFNVGLSSANLSKLELANEIKKFVPGLVIFTDDFKEDVDKRNYIVSNEKIESLGWKPKYTVQDGIREMVKGYIMLFQHTQVFTNL